METVTMFVPVQNDYNFKAKIAEFQKRAEKRGVGTLAVEFLRQEERAKSFLDKTGDKPVEVTVKAMCNVYEVISMPLQIEGYTAVALLDHEVGMVKPFSTERGQDLSRFRGRSNNCDHCKTKRRRNETVILREEKTTKEIQVGLSCVRDFIGIDPALLLSHSEYLADVREFTDDEFCFFSRPDVEIVDYLSVLSVYSREKGPFKSKAQCQSTGEQPTAYAVFDLFRDREYIGKWRDRVEPRDTEFAKTALQYAKDLQPKNDFEHNLKAAADFYCVTEKTLGFVGAIFGAYLRHISEKIERENKPSRFQGAIKEKITRNVRILQVFENEFNAGRVIVCSYLVIMVDDSGNFYRWKSSNPLSDGDGYKLSRNDRATITGTVKEHTLYKDIQQTVLTRCKMVAEAKPKHERD